MTYKPRIGITMRLEMESRRFYLGRDYSEALEGAGAVPVHLPLIAKCAFVESALAGLDGILLPGSDTDIDPAYFGEDPHPKLRKVVPEKDETELLVLAEAERRGLPLLAICYGMQALNVSRGGSLYQDIESQIDGHLKHDQGVPLGRASHTIRIAHESRLAALGNGNLTDGKVKVNSHHHQAIKLVGENLEAVAWANDGIVECIQDTRADRFVLGVQWHPELGWETDGFSRSIFEDFVRHCGNGRNGSKQP